MNYEALVNLFYRTLPMVLFFGVTVAFFILLWATIVWTFQINFAWGVIWFAFSLIIFGGSAATVKGARS